MTDTPSPGAGADARVHGTADALAGVTITHVDRPLSPAEADALLGRQPPPLQPPATLAHESTDPRDVVISVSTLVPNLTALVRWGLQGCGIWLVTHGMSQAREAALEPIATGLALSIGALGWSWVQKAMQRGRLIRAARAHPDHVVFR